MDLSLLRLILLMKYRLKSENNLDHWRYLQMRWNLSTWREWKFEGLIEVKILFYPKVDFLLENSYDELSHFLLIYLSQFSLIVFNFALYFSFVQKPQLQTLFRLQIFQLIWVRKNNFALNEIRTKNFFLHSQEIQ